MRSQGGRGTCSIFSTSAYLEWLIKKQNPQAYAEINLSEEWLAHLAARTEEKAGSTATKNLYLIKKHGLLMETDYPYDFWTWMEGDAISDKYCGALREKEAEYKSCLASHRSPFALTATESDLTNPESIHYDPEFLVLRKKAEENKTFFSTVLEGDFAWARDAVQVKKELYLGRPVILSVPFFYGAWAHRGMEFAGIGKWNQEQFMNGIVGYPEKGSKDRYFSLKKENLNAHSILLVGYDDLKKVKVKMTMMDGSIKEFTYQGVYYFKNSWGTSAFGKNFYLDEVNYPGFGMIVQQHAHEFGGFVYLN